MCRGCCARAAQAQVSLLHRPVGLTGEGEVWTLLWEGECVVLLYWSAGLTLYRSISVCAELNSVCTGDGRVGVGCGEREPSPDGF